MQQFYRNISSHKIHSQHKARPMSLEGQSKITAQNQKRRKRHRKKQSGQLILEYVLLMVVSVSMAVLMKQSLLGGSPGQPCSEIPALSKLICSLTLTIAHDTPGE